MRFADRSPAEVVATLLDEEVYLFGGSASMYRVLAIRGARFIVRSAKRTHPEYKKPVLAWPLIPEPGVVLGYHEADRYFEEVELLLSSTESRTCTSDYVVRPAGGGPGELGPGTAELIQREVERKHWLVIGAPRS